LPELLELMRQRLPWRLLIAGVAGVLAILIAAGAPCCRDRSLAGEE
jgi:hypothetical protein